MNASMINARQAVCFAFFTFGAMAMSGCAADRLGVEPWERGTLARPDMALDASPLSSSIDDHIYFSKEATSGGRGFAGGGCGCN